VIILRTWIWLSSIKAHEDSNKSNNRCCFCKLSACGFFQLKAKLNRFGKPPNRFLFVLGFEEGGMSRPLEHNDGRPDFHPFVKINDIFIQETDAAGRNRLADRIGFIGAMDAEHGISMLIIKIHGPRP